MLLFSGVLVGKRKGGFGKLKQVSMPLAAAKPQKDAPDVVERAETNASVEPELAEKESVAQDERGESNMVAPEVMEGSKRPLSSPPAGVVENEERAMRGPQIPDRLKEALQKEAEESSEQGAQPSEPEAEPKEKRGRQVNFKLIQKIYLSEIEMK